LGLSPFSAIGAKLPRACRAWCRPRRTSGAERPQRDAAGGRYAKDEYDHDYANGHLDRPLQHFKSDECHGSGYQEKSTGRNNSYTYAGGREIQK
jgi:hypothetical protein